MYVISWTQVQQNKAQRVYPHAPHIKPIRMYRTQSNSFLEREREGEREREIPYESTSHPSIIKTLQKFVTHVLLFVGFWRSNHL